MRPQDPDLPPATGTESAVDGYRRDDGGALGSPGWRLFILADVTNFGALRRTLGRWRAGRLIDDVAAIAAAAWPGARLAPVSRSMLEIAFEGRTPTDADAAIAALRRCFDQPIDIDGAPHRIEMLFAGAAMPIHDDDDVRLIEAAEAALGQARTDQIDIVRDLTQIEHAYDRMALIRDLSAAINNGEIFLQYQPKVHLRQQEIVSVEALVRWQHPTRGLIAPADFIPLAEESRKIGALTLWTIRKVIADQQLLAAAGFDIPIFVNISGMLLADAEFVDQVCTMVRGVPTKIGFEITETAVIRDPESAIRHLHTFAQIGVTLAIDDYGAGLSSLAYLKQLPARELKIDKMFVLELTSSNRDPLIVRSTIDLAHALDMEVTAEGVETPAALALLSVMGCDMAQGFLISRPIAIDAMIQFLEQDRHLGAMASMRPTFGRPEAFWKRA
ncbi:EAL domain-containing protein [Sphingomonas sp. S1-29]|uniref:EAL domain-containing protein n=1 Tax=Sphingomonas sp. S1-29 TaxID=2991074 RepID=UPI00223ED432|nr:EAL domain-containing protein [Sphingomonas sp. S1-29]UZK71146.1 EAL domain-containing protein [Sphingomonas sp. S1-29]